MENSVAKICRGTAIIIGIISFIGGFFGAKESADFSKELFGRGYSGADMNWTIALVVWVSAFLFCLFLYAIAEVIDLLQGILTIEHKQRSQMEIAFAHIVSHQQKPDDIAVETEKVSEDIAVETEKVSEDIHKNRSSDFSWVCSSCGELNLTERGPICKKCGATEYLP